MTNATMTESVQEVLDKLRPFLLRDGGDCELVDIEDGIEFVNAGHSPKCAIWAGTSILIFLHDGSFLRIRFFLGRRQFGLID